MNNKVYYEYLKSLKIKNKLFDFQYISKGQLRELWYSECIPDSMIAELFEIKKGKVTYTRKKLGINDRVCLLEDFAEIIN